MKNGWEKVVRKVKFLGCLILFAASIGAAVYGFATDVAAATPTETPVPTETAQELVLTKETKASGEIVFRLEPAEDHEYPLAETEEAEADEDEAEEEPEDLNPAKAEKRFLLCWEEGLSAEPVRATQQAEATPFEQAPQPTVFVQATSTKTIEEYAGSIDYDAVLQGPVIYDFGPEGELALEWTVWHEARGEPFDGQVAVAAAAINRLYSDCPWFTDKSSIIGILSQKYQFAYKYVSPENLAAYPDVHRAVQCAIRGADPTVCEAFPEGCMWYYNPKETTATFSDARYELVIGHHHFHNNGDTWH